MDKSKQPPTEVEILRFNPCMEALQFRLKFDSFESAWNACQRADWMLWLAHKLRIGNRKTTLAKGLCAQTVIDLMGNDVSKEATRLAISYGQGDASIEELNGIALKAFQVTYDKSRSEHFAAFAAYSVVAHSQYLDTTVATQNAVIWSKKQKGGLMEDAIELGVENKKRTADICRDILTKDVLNKISKL